MVDAYKFHDFKRLKNKQITVQSDCELCGNTSEFFIGEVWHLCKHCRQIAYDISYVNFKRLLDDKRRNK